MISVVFFFGTADWLGEHDAHYEHIGLVGYPFEIQPKSTPVPRITPIRIDGTLSTMHSVLLVQ